MVEKLKQLSCLLYFSGILLAVVSLMTTLIAIYSWYGITHGDTEAQLDQDKASVKLILQHGNIQALGFSHMLNVITSVLFCRIAY